MYLSDQPSEETLSSLVIIVLLCLSIAQKQFRVQKDASGGQDKEIERIVDIINGLSVKIQPSVVVSKAPRPQVEVRFRRE